jgi:chromosome segregation ATPase
MSRDTSGLSDRAILFAVLFHETDRDLLKRVLIELKENEAAVAAVQTTLDNHTRKLEKIMSDQSHLDTDIAQLQAQVATLNTAAAAIQTEIASIKSANPTVDFTGLDQLVSDLSTATAAVEANVPPPPATP